MSENKIDKAYWRRWTPGEPDFRWFTNEMELPFPVKTREESEAMPEGYVGDSFDSEYVYEIVVYRHKRGADDGGGSGSDG